jgi:hypothetical protein
VILGIFKGLKHLRMEKTNVSGLPVLEDFDLFLAFLRSNKEIPLTNEKAQLKRTDLYHLNAELHFKADWVTDKSMQSAYPELEFFYGAVLAGKLARIGYGEKGNYLQPDPDQLERYSLLTVQSNISSCCKRPGATSTGPSSARPVVCSSLLSGGSTARGGRESAGHPLEVDMSYSRLRLGKAEISLSLINKVVQIFGFLGLYAAGAGRFRQETGRYTFPFRTLTTSEAGTVLTPCCCRNGRWISGTSVAPGTRHW